MKTFVVVSALLMGLSTVSSASDDTLHINSNFFTEEYVIYRGENDITKIVVPLNSINFNQDTDMENIDLYTFFVETGKGLYVLKSDEATFLLKEGKDVGSSMDDSKDVYIASANGLYTFNPKTMAVDKYGTLTDNIKSIVVTNGTSEIYILTEDRILYKVTDEGTNKEEVTNVKDAVQIVLDTSNNLYFLDGKRNVYVRDCKEGTLTKVKGLPGGKIELLRPPPLIEDGIIAVVGKKLYKIDADGEAEYADLIIYAKPTAYATEGTMVMYFARDKKIYQYGIFDLLVATSNMMEPVQAYVNKKAPNFKESAKKKALRQ